MILCKLGDGN